LLDCLGGPFGVLDRLSESRWHAIIAAYHAMRQNWRAIETSSSTNWIGKGCWPYPACHSHLGRLGALTESRCLTYSGAFDQALFGLIVDLKLANRTT